MYGKTGVIMHPKKAAHDMATSLGTPDHQTQHEI